MKSLNCVLTTSTEACAHSTPISRWSPGDCCGPYHTCPHHYPLAPLWVPSSCPALRAQTRSPLGASGHGCAIEVPAQLKPKKWPGLRPGSRAAPSGLGGREGWCLAPSLPLAQGVRVWGVTLWDRTRGCRPPAPLHHVD